MIVIRPEQIKAFEQATLKSFEDEMVEHLQDFAPKLFEIRGEDCFRKVIQLGIERAENYGFTNKGSVRFYIETMVSIGCDFDTDPQYPWATTILNDDRYIDQMQKADYLYNAVIDFLDKAMGPENKYAASALKKISNEDYSSLNIQENNFSNSFINLCYSVFPEKAGYVGEKQLLKLINEGQEQSLKYGIGSTKGRTVITGLMFMFGHGVIYDLLYQWVLGTINNSRNIDSNGRVNRLYKKITIYTELVSEYLTINFNKII